MTLTTDCLKSMAAIMGGSGAIPSYIAVGAGSTAPVSGNTALVSETVRKGITSIDLTVAKDVTYIADYSSTELSGTVFAEWGLFNASTAGSMFKRETFPTVGSIVFAGDLELQIQSTIRFGISGA